MNTFGIELFDTSVRPITIIDRSGNEEDLPLSISIDKVEYQRLVTSEFEVLNQHSLSNLTFPITTTGALTTDSLTITGDGIVNIHSETGMLKFNSEVTGEQQTIQAVDDEGFRLITSASETNSVNTCLQIYNISEGSVADGFGGEMLFVNEADNGLFNITGKIQFITTDVSASSPDGKFSFHLTQNGTIAEKMSLSEAGNLVTAGTITDGSGNVLGSGGGGAIDISGTPSTNQYARWTDADTLEGRSTSDVLSDIGAQASGNYITGTGSLSAQDLTDIGNLSGTNTGDGTYGISNTNYVKIDSASVADDEYARFTANGLESRSTSEVLSDIGVYDFQRVGYNSATASASFLPMNGYIVEVTSISTRNEFAAFIAPYNGTLEKILWRSEEAQSGTFRNLLYESSDGTEAPGAGHGRWDVAVDVADDTTIEFDFTTGATSGTNVLTKGRIYAISIDPVSIPYDVNATVVFKWDVTT